MSFTLTLGNVLLTLLYILPGYAFCKWRKLKGEHLTTLSALLVYLCSPCQMVSSFLAVDFSPGEATYMVLFFIVTLVLQSIFMGIVYLLLCRKHKDSKYRIFSIATVLGNVGFFGQPLVRALLPNNPEALCYSMVFSLSMELLMIWFEIIPRLASVYTPDATSKSLHYFFP
jgi:predicted permease